MPLILPQTTPAFPDSLTVLSMFYLLIFFNFFYFCLVQGVAGSTRGRGKEEIPPREEAEGAHHWTGRSHQYSGFRYTQNIIHRYYWKYLQIVHTGLGVHELMCLHHILVLCFLSYLFLLHTPPFLLLSVPRSSRRAQTDGRRL